MIRSFRHHDPDCTSQRHQRPARLRDRQLLHAGDQSWVARASSQDTYGRDQQSHLGKTVVNSFELTTFLTGRPCARDAAGLATGGQLDRAPAAPIPGYLLPTGCR